MEVTLSKYLNEVLSRKLHLVRSWRLQAFAIKETYVMEPYYPFPTATGVGFNNAAGEEVRITDSVKAAALTPILPFYTEFTLASSDMNILKSDIKTTLGTAIVNYIAFSPFHPRYPYINGPITPKDITAPFLSDLIAGNRDAEYDKLFISSMSDLESLLAVDSEFALRSMVEGQFTHDKAHEELRNKLIEENKDNLEDPLIVAKIQQRLAKSTAERYKKIGATLWTGGKSHSGTLMKTDGMYGSEMSIEGKGSKYVVKSLKEGIELKDIGTHVGVARYGSYGRGKLTAEGGAGVNAAYRAMQSRQCTGDDCGSKEGRVKRIRSHNYKLFIGQALAGGTAYLSEAQLKMYIGKSIKIRVAGTCKSPADIVCKACGGREIARMPESIPTKAAGLMSTLMGVSMSATHHTEAQTTRLDFFDDIY